MGLGAMYDVHLRLIDSLKSA